MLTRSDGSARWAQDGVVVLAAVLGPRQAGAKKEDAERAIVEVVFKGRSGLQGEAQNVRVHIDDDDGRCLMQPQPLAVLTT